MADECVFYYFDGSDYCCRLLKENDRKYEVDSEWVHRYCWGYNYDDCPYRQSLSSGSSGCYLTSACTKVMGLSDDCVELRLLRNYRDTYVRNLPEGDKYIRRYYEVAPLIVRAINANSQAVSIWRAVYFDLVLPCVSLIKKQQYAEAFEKYEAYTEKLKKMYL